MDSATNNNDTALPQFMNPCQKVRTSCKHVVDSSDKEANVAINKQFIDQFVKDVQAKVDQNGGVAYDSWK